MSIPIHWFIDQVDRSRSISTVAKDSHSGEYCWYRRSMPIHLRRITVDRRWSIKNWDNFVVDFIDDTSNRKIWKLKKIGDSGTKPVILKYRRCTNYCKHIATAGEITQQESWLCDELVLLSFTEIHSLHQIATVTPSHVPPRRHGIIIVIFHYFGTNCMVPLRLGLSTKVRLWSQFLIWFNQRVSNFFGC